MTKIELLEMLKNCAIKYRKDTNSVSRNQHLTNMKEEPSQEIKDAVLIDFINYVGMFQGIDYALAVEDIQ
jgi:hypothetical protein